MSFKEIKDTVNKQYLQEEEVDIVLLGEIGKKLITIKLPSY